MRVGFVRAERQPLFPILHGNVRDSVLKDLLRPNNLLEGF